MSQAKPKRKKQYRPRQIAIEGGLIAIHKVHQTAQYALPICNDDQTDLSIAYWLSFEQMTRGNSSEESWSVIACSLNVALILAERGIGKEYEPYIIKALDGAFRARVRADHHRHRVWRFDGDAINAIRQAFEIHDEQIKIATKEEMRSALLEVYTRIENNHVYKEAA